MKASSTFPEVYKLNTPAVSAMNYGEKSTENGIQVFAALIVNIVKFYGGEWRAEQVYECAKTIFGEWHYLTFAELRHFAQKAKTGEFKYDGRALMYGAFSPAVLIDWLVRYVSETDANRGEYFGKFKVRDWQEPANPVDTERIKELVADMEQEFLTEQEADRLRIDETISKTQKAINDLKKYDDEHRTISE